MIETHLGKLDGVIHCAAELGYLLPLTEIDAKRWQRLMAINLHAPLALTQAVLPLLKCSGHGQAIFVGDSACGDGKAFWGAYGVAKAGLKAYASIFQQEMESFGLKSLYFEPDAMRSPIRLSAYPGEDHQALPLPEVPAERLIDTFLKHATSLR
jgi:NAD(P)-dependent dehydrogenase (short-subunit alcohol dehydrogenase family)